jgi:transcriptional regulator with GAF, ATPase, and Fis domain
MQQERAVADLKRLIEELTSEERPPETDPVPRVAEQFAKAFHVQPDEVAILALTDGNKFLKFLFPEKLKTIGSIPLTSTTALAARTAREKKAELINNFASVPHATVFEGIPLGRSEGEWIHKIMSVPVSVNNKVVGVIQISHKGHSALQSGPDFTSQELRALAAMSGVLGEFLLSVKAI